MRENSELMVITKAKDLVKYVFTACENSPKKFRFTLVTRMNNTSLDVLENLILANEILLGDSDYYNAKRREYQQAAIAKLKVLDALAMAAREQQCILPKQHENISRLLSDCLKLTGAWIASDKKRIN